MPFFSVFVKKNQKPCQQAKSLQVPCITIKINERMNQLPEKRALLFTSGSRGRATASMTVEAALSLPLFLFFAAALMTPMRWLNRQRQVQTVLESFCEELTQYIYAMEAGEQEWQDTGGSGRGTELAGVLSEGAAGLWLKGKAGEYADGVIVTWAEAPDESGDIRFEVEYKEKIPFFSVGSGVSMKAASRRRCFVGLDGKLKETGTPGGETLDGDERIVYVGASMGRYHLYRDCHYISNQYETVPADQAVTMKNAAGQRYVPCSRCAKGDAPGGEVYITRAGEHYHFSRACSSMVSYVRNVPLKDVEYLGVCSWCAGKGSGE